MNSKMKTVASFAFILLFSRNAFSFSGGISGYSGNPATHAGSTCSNCHSGGTAPTVILSGPSSVQPGTINTFTFTISGGQQHSGGLNISTDAGTFINTQAATRLLSSEITHKQRAIALTDGSITWNFDWQAPTAAGSYTLYGAGLSTNGDSNTLQDAVANYTHLITVSNAAPQSPTAIILAPITAQPNTSINFDASASFDPDGTINQYDWNFADGSTANGAQTTHIFSDAGNYTATLIVTDNDNLTSSTFRDIGVGAVMVPVAEAGGSYSGTEAQSLSFDASLSSHVTAVSSYIWDFGDGSAVVQDVIPTTTHTYSQPGSYTLTLAVQDADIITGVTSTSVVITAAAPPPLPPATDGPTLYANNCASCHGVLATSSKLNKAASQIQAAIDANTGGMAGLNSLTSENIQAIADALLNNMPPPPPTDGPTLYANNCASCHGVLASSSKLNKTSTQIQAAIDANTGGMGGFSNLTPTEVQAIAEALVTASPPPPVTDGPTLYANNCASCHGVLASSSKLNKTSTQIQVAINANTGGMGGLSGLTPTDVQAIADALVNTTPPPPPTDGQSLYTNNCASCHGALAASSKLNKTASQIQAAINANTGGMGGFSSLTPTEVQAIADALVNTTPPPTPTTGQQLYDSYCLVCHGSGGTGGLHQAVTGEPASSIESAISNESLMSSIVLDASQIQSIADYLSSSVPPPPVTGEALYNSYCLACHGVRGSGGAYEDVTGKNAGDISDAISAESLMNSISLSAAQIQNIADYLSNSGGGGTTPPPAPTDGASLYTNNCSGCHGALASSSKLNKTAGQIQAAIDANTGGMGGLSNLTPTNVQAIADALISGGGTPPPVPPPVPVPADGASLYTSNCSGCHNPLASSSKLNRSANQIQAAIDANTGGMGGLSNLTPTEVLAISDALAGGGTTPTPTTGEQRYITQCQSCHGFNGTGGSAKAIVGVSNNQITTAVSNIAAMQNIQLNATDAQNIAGFLSSGGGAQPPPTTGADIYAIKCAACHGTAGNGGNEEAVIGASENDIQDAIQDASEMQAIPLSNGEAQALATYLAGEDHKDGGHDGGGHDDEHD